MRNFEKVLQISVENLQSFGRLYFTPKQLFYECCRQTASPVGLETKTAAAIFGLSAVSAPFFGKNKFNFLTASGLFLGTFAALRKMPHTLPTPISRQEFERFLADYLQKNEIEGLLEAEKEIEFVKGFPPDLTLYGLPRVLICEKDELAQMLRANQFHLQTPCAVLSLREVKPLSKVYKKMLEKAESPQVFFLHDASLEALKILSNLRDTLNLDEKIPLHPLGLRPVHARRLHLFAEKKFFGGIDFPNLNFLDDSEKKWLLRGNSAEVSAVSPVRLLRVLRRLILDLEIPPSEWQIQLPQKSLGFM